MAGRDRLPRRVDNFAGQWLGTRELGKEFNPDADRFKSYNKRLESVMRSEPAYFLHGMLARNASVLDLIDSLNDQGKTIVLVTHDNYVAERSHRVIHMKDGVVDREEVKRQPGEARKVVQKRR